ncbi:hypothetical protein [Neptuniibacter sp.]|uniref:hypothetical protein n=1 Tax=Neptuniibacter sp. TaxID=1962643 RepID=UPI002610F763|nr:hypothetical protein [Neptuniibacter sp.]MCP4597123.1 hypothetical protein [Neptuniibacter sp.]
MKSLTEGKCERSECTDLLDELAQLKEQLEQAELQLGMIEKKDEKIKNLHNEGARNSSDQFDVSDVSDVLYAAPTDVQVKPTPEWISLLNNISGLVNHSGDEKVESGTLIVCVFSAISQDEVQISEIAITQNEVKMIDGLINSCSHKGDLTAYISHFERAVFIPEDPDGAAAALFSDRLIAATDKYKAPKGFEGLKYKCSIGIAVFPSDASEIDTLFRYADRAAYSSLKISDSYYSYYK